MIEARSCRADGCEVQVWMLEHVRTRKVAPIEVEPVRHGNIAVNLQLGVYSTLTRAELAEVNTAVAAGADVPLYRSHFAACPAARQWRRGSTQPAATTAPGGHHESTRSPSG